MFWRKQRAAIEGFHPLHQALIHHRAFTATLRPADWELLIQSLARHDELVRRRKWSPPPRARVVLVPLLRILGEDMAAKGTLSVALDLRGPDLREKRTGVTKLPGDRQRRIRKILQWWAFDPWLRMRAELRDGSVLELTVTDRLRHRRISKTSRSGKHKSKNKTKTVQILTATRKLPPGMPYQRPATPPPRWITPKFKEGRRTVIRASAKLAAASDERMLTEQILNVSTETFRWTPPGATRPVRRIG
ncbi:hypothetical protein [Spirillospora sp. CA-294931]|uniref:hypothetical protein n=1 Tax=Spirillospora sp. CA-294931 TaxID=3240042 RepID=UPI003D936970